MARERLGALDEGRLKIDKKGAMVPGASVDAKINQRALGKSMNENEQMMPPQWLGRPIVSPEHVRDLETRAAINEFHSRMPRAQAEAKAHEDYVRDQRELAAAHHLKGMRAAQAVGNHEDAQKHWMMYDLHMKGLGQQSIGPVTPEIEKRMLEDQKPVYKFKAHKGDLYALDSANKETAPPEGEPIQKAEDLKAHVFEKGKRPFKAGQRVYQTSHTGEKFPYTIGSNEYKMMRYMDADHPHVYIKPEGWKGSEGWYPLAALHFEDDMAKAEAKQCKWKLGERRCKRMVTTDYCHDHVSHWANKINQQPLDKAEVAQELLKGLKDLLGRLEKNALPPAGLNMPPASAATPQLHNTVEGFMQGLKALPREPAARGKFITQHMNHAPFLAALKQHPQGPAVHQMLTQHMNSAANAGFKAGKTVVAAK